MTHSIYMLLVGTAPFVARSLPAQGMMMPAPRDVADSACVVDDGRRAAMMAASYDAFDQTMSGAMTWRPLMMVGCYETIANLIAQYLERNAATLSPDPTRTLYFHAGQALAFASKAAAALPYMERAASSGTAEWHTYTRATIAFLKGDRQGFDEARREYHRVAPNSPRRGILASLASCPGLPYREAAACPRAKDPDSPRQH